MPCGATQDGRVMVERSDRMVHWRREWQTKYSCLENPMNSMKRQNDRTLKEGLPRSISAQYTREISGEITPERMTGWSQSKNNIQLWM